MEDLIAAYDRLAAGATDAPMHQARRLQYMARERCAGSVDDRLGAIAVATALGTNHGLPILRDLAVDADLKVRSEVLYRALALGAVGLPVLRRMIADDDDELAVNVLEHLVRAADEASANATRRLLRDPRARVRAAAATLLGIVGGPGVQIDLRKLETDEDDDVKVAASLAIQQIRGEVEKPAANPWWEPEAPAETPEPRRGPVVENLSLSAARRLTRDPDAGMREAAAKAIGELGGVSTILELGKLCSDDDPGVRDAAKAAMKILCDRVERPDLGQRFLD